MLLFRTVMKLNQLLGLGFQALVLGSLSLKLKAATGFEAGTFGARKGRLYLFFKFELCEMRRRVWLLLRGA